MSAQSDVVYWSYCPQKTQKWTKMGPAFSCIPFKPKFKIFKDFSNTVFFLLETTYGRNVSKIKQNLGSKGPKNPPKWAISWILNPYKRLLILQISQPHKLYWWNLPQTYIWIRSFIWQNYGVYLPGCTRA